MKKVIKSLAIIYYGFINLIFVLTLVAMSQTSQMSTTPPKYGAVVLAWIIFNVAGIVFVPLARVWR